MESGIAILLRSGTWIASILLAAGLLVPGQGGPALTRCGVALFILLPVSRVLLMLVQFLRRRDLVHAAIALLVLVMVGTGLVLGVDL